MGIVDWSPEVLVQGPLEQSVVSDSCMAKTLLVSHARWHDGSLCLMLSAVPAMHSLARQCWLVVGAGLRGVLQG